MRKLGLFLVLFTLFSQSSLAFFKDIYTAEEMGMVTDHHYYTSIKWMYDNGVVEGYSDGTFKSDQKVNRAEFLKMLYETMNIDVEEVKDVDPFTDVPKDEWYTNYVRKAYLDGVIDGYSDRSFRPGQTINFAEAAKIISNTFFTDIEKYDKMYDVYGYDFCLTDFKKYYSKDWFYPYISLIDSYCVIPGYVNGISGFYPGNLVTRGDMAEMLYRAKAVSDNYYPGLTRNYEIDLENEILVPVPRYMEIDSAKRMKIVGLDGGYWMKLVLKNTSLVGTVMDYGNYSPNCVDGLGAYCNTPTVRFVVDPSDRWKIYSTIDNFHIGDEDYDSLKQHFGAAFTIKLDEIVNFSEGYAAYEYELTLED